MTKTKKTPRWPRAAHLVGLLGGLGCSTAHLDLGSTGTGTGGAGGAGGGAIDGVSRTFALGGRHACATIDATRVRCWGENDRGQVGLLPPDSHADCAGVPCQELPNTISFENDVEAVFAGRKHSCVLLEDENLHCFGDNHFGQLGRGTADADAHATPLRPLSVSGVQSAALGAFHSCFVSSGELFCAGLGEQGQLGVSPDTLESCTTPDPAWIEEGDGAGEVACRTSFARVAMNGSVDAVVAGLFSTCARVDGAWRCFGSNRRGELGRGATSDFEWEPGALAFSRGIQQVALGGRQICLLDDEDLVFCAGENGLGELGIGTAPSEECETGLCRLSFGPLSDRQGLQAVVALVGAGCVLDGAGAVACFGGDARGVLGNSKGAPDECSGVPCSRRPVDVYRIVDQLEIDAGDDFVCTRRADQTIHCWGDNEMAQLAQGSPGGYYDIPTQAYGLTP